MVTRIIDNGTSTATTSSGVVKGPTVSLITMILTNNANATEIRDLFKLKSFPGRLAAWEAAAILGFSDNEIPILVAAKLLHPLGNPAHSAPKWFATSDLLEKCKDRAWLDDATCAISRHWRRKNQRKSSTMKSV